MSWRRFGVLVRGLPVTSRSYQAVHGERWSRTDNLIAALYDLTAVGNWQRAGNKRNKKPTPLPRPGVNNKGQRFGTKAMSIDDWRSRQATRFSEGGDHGHRARDRVHQPRTIR